MGAACAMERAENESDISEECFFGSATCAFYLMCFINSFLKDYTHSLEWLRPEMTNMAELNPQKITLGNSTVFMVSSFLKKKKKLSQSGTIVRRMGLYSQMDLHLNLSSIVS